MIMGEEGGEGGARGVGATGEGGGGEEEGKEKGRKENEKSAVQEGVRIV